MPDPSLNSLTAQLWRLTDAGKEPHLYTILDAARDEQIYLAILRSDNEYICLYRGDHAIDLADVAPYLVKLERGDSFTNWLLSDGRARAGEFSSPPMPRSTSCGSTSGPF